MPQDTSSPSTSDDLLLKLTGAQSQALGYQRELMAAQRAATQELALKILGLVGVHCIKEFLPEDLAENAAPNQASADSAEPELGLDRSRLILFEHLDPRYIQTIVTKLLALKAHGDLSLSTLSVAITQMALPDLELGPTLPAWVVSNDQNATYWRNNIEPNTIKLCAISIGENEDTLSNITDRINSDGLKQHLASKTVLYSVLTQLLSDLQESAHDSTAPAATPSAGYLSGVPQALSALLTNPLRSDLATTLSALMDTMSLKPIDLCTYIAAVLIHLAQGASAQGSTTLHEALGLALPTFQVPREQALFLSKSKSPKPYTKAQVKKLITGTLKARPTTLNYAATTGLPLDTFKTKQLKDNLSALLAATLPVKAETAAGSETEDLEELPVLDEWEAGLIKEFVAATGAPREALFAPLCTIEWNGKLERLFNAAPQATQKKSLYERTMDLFNDHLTNESKLSPAEEATIELVKQNVKDLTRADRNELNDLYQSRRAIFDQDSALSREWEKYIYYEDVIAEPNFLLSLSKALLNLARSVDDHSEEELASLTLTLDGTTQQILSKNYAVMAYFSLRYGAFLRDLTERLPGRLIVDYAGSNTTSHQSKSEEAPLLNPLFNFPEFFSAKAQNQRLKRSTSGREKDLTLDLVLTPTYRQKEAQPGAKLEQGKPFKIAWQLRPERVSYLFAADLEALLVGPSLRSGLFEHDALTAQGTLQDLSLYNHTTLLFPGLKGKGEATFFGPESSCDLGAKWENVWAQLEQLVAAYLPDEGLTSSIAAIKAQWADFSTRYRHSLEQLKACTIRPQELHELSHSYSSLLYELLSSPLIGLQQGTSPATLQLKELLALVLQVGMSYRKSASVQDVSYAIATPFTVEALRSHACKLERCAELICDIFKKPISINDRAVFLNSLEQDLNYYDAPELCLNQGPTGALPSTMPGMVPGMAAGMGYSAFSELIATQALGGYTLYVAPHKLYQDQGPKLSAPLAAKTRGRKKATAAPVVVGAQGGGGCVGLGGANVSSNSSELVLTAIGSQINSYLEHSPYPLTQCTLMLSHCPVPSFALELYRLLKREQRAKWPHTHLNLVIVCPDINRAQDIFALFESERFALKQTLEGPEFVKAVSVTILLAEQGGNTKRFGTLNDYLERMSLQQTQLNSQLNAQLHAQPSFLWGNWGAASNATNGRASEWAHERAHERFAQIGLMVHAFDAQAQFQFSAPYEVPLVTDEVHYQPSLINMVDARPNGTMGRFVVSPVLPLSKILLQHSLYYLTTGDFRAVTSVQAKLKLALTKQAKTQTVGGRAAAALGLSKSAKATAATTVPTIATPLYARAVPAAQGPNSWGNLLYEAVAQIHKSCDAVFYLDDLLERKQLKQMQVRVLYYQKLPQNTLNFIIATQVNVEAKTRTFLQKIVADTDLSPQEQGTCLQQVAEASLNISGRLLMRAQLRHQHAAELMGVVLTGYMGQAMMDTMAQHYHDAGKTYRTLVYLDDYQAIFKGVGNQRQKRLADLLGIQIITQQSEHGEQGASGERYLLNLVVLESKFLERSSTDAAKRSLKQTRETTELLHRAFKRYATRHSLDRKQWLARIADMLVDNSDQLDHSVMVPNGMGPDEFSRIQQRIRNGQVDILLKGCSLIFARHGEQDEEQNLIATPWCEAHIDPKLDQSSPQQGFPLVQAKLTGRGMSAVLESFSRNKGLGSAQALQELSATLHDDTIIQYCTKPDERFILKAELPAEPVTPDQVAPTPAPAPKPVTAPQPPVEPEPQVAPQPEPIPVPEQVVVAPAPTQPTEPEFKLESEVLGRDSGLGLADDLDNGSDNGSDNGLAHSANLLGAQSAPLIHEPPVAHPNANQQTAVQPTANQPTTPAPAPAVVVAEPTSAPAPVAPTAPQSPERQPSMVLTEHPVTLAPPRSKWLMTVPRRPYDGWRPDVAALLPRSQHDEARNQAQLEAKCVQIDAVLREFGVDAKVERYVPGPILTRFVLKLGYGETSKAIERIVAEMPRKLNVPTVRFIAASVSLEVPNEQRLNITLGDVLTSPEFAQTKAGLALALGLTTDGMPVVRDLVEGGPHLLVAGTTGSGKSVGLNAILLSLIAQHSPQTLRLIIIDPKREFQAYDALPHMLAPAIKDVTVDAMAALRWCIGEMERRYELFDDVLKTSSLLSYNQYIQREQAAGRRVRNYFVKTEDAPEFLAPLPRIVVVIDEFNDLMAQNRATGRSKGTEFEDLIVQLAGKCRAAGIHLILATQSPRTKVVTGLIKGNLPARIAFKVSDYHESQIILDENGAEELLGKGDMLHRFSNETTHRAHGAYVTSTDISAMVKAWHEHSGDPEYLAALPQGQGLSLTSPEDLSALQARARQLAQEHKAQGLGLTERDLRHQMGVNSLTAQKLLSYLQAQSLVD